MKVIIILFLVFSNAAFGAVGPCPHYEGVFRCPKLMTSEGNLPAYNYYVEVEEKEGVKTYTSWMSVSPEKTSTIVADGLTHQSQDFHGKTRNYVAHCEDGKIINRYSSKRGFSETRLWVNAQGDLKIQYDFAPGETLTCKKVN